VLAEARVPAGAGAPTKVDSTVSERYRRPIGSSRRAAARERRMDAELQRALMRRALAHLDAGTTDVADDVYLHPVASYTDAVQLARERERLFRGEPLLAAWSCQMPRPGDHLADDRSGVPILLVRGEDGRVRAFLNVCRHRAARVAEGAGNRRQLVCPYHGWTYGLDGRLVGVPDRRSFPGVEPADNGLVPLPAAERNGLIWVLAAPRADGDASLDARAHLGGLDAEFESYGLAGYHHYETRLIRRRMNWKLVIDTFLEPYHLGVLHRNTVAPLFHPNTCLFDAFGPHLREVLPRRSIESQRGVPAGDWAFLAHHTVVYVLFPNTVFVMQVDHAETWRVFPVEDRVDECEMFLDFFVPQPIDTDSARRHWERNMDLTIRTVCDEDFPVSEAMQRNFASGAPSHSYFGRNEPALAHFERTVSQRVAAHPPRER
jgi:phenylpropionate dioxygenase-like ring-hydroxylating dioxygenase large terminal subunit